MPDSVEPQLGGECRVEALRGADGLVLEGLRLTLDLKLLPGEAASAAAGSTRAVLRFDRTEARPSGLPLWLHRSKWALFGVAAVCTAIVSWRLLDSESAETEFETIAIEPLPPVEPSPPPEATVSASPEPVAPRPPVIAPIAPAEPIEDALPKPSQPATEPAGTTKRAPVPRSGPPPDVAKARTNPAPAQGAGATVTPPDTPARDDRAAAPTAAAQAAAPGAPAATAMPAETTAAAAPPAEPEAALDLFSDTK